MKTGNRLLASVSNYQKTCKHALVLIFDQSETTDTLFFQSLTIKAIFYNEKQHIQQAITYIQ